MNTSTTAIDAALSRFIGLDWWPKWRLRLVAMTCSVVAISYSLKGEHVTALTFCALSIICSGLDDLHAKIDARS